MTSNVTQVHPNWRYSMGHISLSIDKRLFTIQR